MSRGVLREISIEQNCSKNVLQQKSSNLKGKLGKYTKPSNHLISGQKRSFDEITNADSQFESTNKRQKKE
jgi:hypothetical protein